MSEYFDDINYKEPPFEEVHGIGREQMEFEALPLDLQEFADRLGHDDEDVINAIGRYRSEHENAVRVVVREMEIERLKEKKKKQMSGFTDHNASLASDTDVLARKVQGFYAAEVFKCEAKKVIKIDAMEKYDISKATYHRLLTRKLP